MNTRPSPLRSGLRFLTLPGCDKYVSGAKELKKPSESAMDINFLWCEVALSMSEVSPGIV